MHCNKAGQGSSHEGCTAGAKLADIRIQCKLRNAIAVANVIQSSSLRPVSVFGCMPPFTLSHCAAVTCLEGQPELVAPPGSCIAAICLASFGVLPGVQVKNANLHTYAAVGLGWITGSAAPLPARCLKNSSAIVPPLSTSHVVFSAVPASACRCCSRA